MNRFSKGMISSVGYSFAFAALCSLALAPQAALADDEQTESATSGSSASATTGKRVYDAPVADQKDETVYVFANADGSVKNTEVSTTLKNPLGEDELADSSVLTDIENVEGDETYAGEGDGMVWSAAGNDIYYTGATDKQVPVSVKVTYFLDGQKVAPEKLAGVSGKLKIRYDYDNTATVKAAIQGKDETLYVPFTFITALMFDDDNFKNAKVTNGKLINDGDRVIVAGYAIPGLQKSLGSLVEDFDIPDYFEVTADVTDFEMKTSLTIATAGLLEDFDADDIDTSELEDASRELADAMDEILDGTGELKEGLDKLAEGAKSASTASGQLASGADALKEGAQTVTDAVGDKGDTAADKTLLGGINSLKSGYDSQLYNPVKETVKTIETYLEQNKTNISAAWEALQGMDKAIDALGKAIKALGKVDKSDLKTLSAQLSDVKDKLDNAQESIGEAEGMIKKLQGLDLSGVESGMKSVGSDLTAAGDGLAAAGGLLEGDVTDDLKGIGASAKSAGDNLKSAIGKLESFDVEKLGLNDEQANALSKALSGVTEDLSSAGSSLSGISESLGSAQEHLGYVGQDISEAGTSIKSAGTTLSSIGSALTSLKESMPSAEKISEIQSLLDAAKGALTDENVEIMDQCIDSLNKSMAKLDIDELNGEIALLKQEYPKVTKYIEGTSAQDAIKQLKQKLDAAVEGMGEVSEGMASEQKGLQQLKKGTDQLADGAAQLADGTQKFDEGLTALADGAQAAADGTGTLQDGLQQFNDEGISEISDLIDDDILPFKDRLTAISDAAKNYNNFAGITDGTSGSVKFVIETDGISIDE